MKASSSIHFFDKSFKEVDGIYSPVDLLQAKRNRQNLVEYLGAHNILILKQVHGKVVVDADNATDFFSDPEADAAVTSKKGIALAIQTADCVPVLLEAEGVVGAAHCGWKSIKKDILIDVVALMKKKGASFIKATIGPAIWQDSYEVDLQFKEEIIKETPNAQSLFKVGVNKEKFLFDLIGFVVLKLNALGVVKIDLRSENTYTNPEKYYSYRRDTHLGTSRGGKNLLSTILLPL